MPAHRTRTETHDCDCAQQRPHGTAHTYRYHFCGCDACLDEHLRYQKVTRVNKAAGRGAYVKIAPVAKRLQLLRSHGVPTRQIALELGYSPGALYRIAQRKKPYCRRELAEAVMEYPVPNRKRSK